MPTTSPKAVYFRLRRAAEKRLLTESTEPGFSSVIVDPENRGEVQIRWHDLVISERPNEHLARGVQLSH